MDDKSTWQGYEKYDHAFSYDQIDDFFNELAADEVDLVSTKPEYLNIPASFDIETTSLKDEEGEKFATMYIWQLGINGSVIYGRTWQQFVSIISQLAEFYDLEADKRHLILYVHNLGYEFQFMRNWFEWNKVFSVKNRRPLYALESHGIEFRCSLLLSNYALAYVGSNLLLKYPVQKMVGDLDYSKPRHSRTPITKAELGYCLNDVRVVMSYIQEKIEQDGDISRIPLTNTGYVRNYCREFCYGLIGGEYSNNKKKYEYRALMKNMTIQSEREYDDLKNAFAGGFTHANAFHSGETCHKVGSADLCSSYPFTMVADYFPMSRGIFIGTVTPSQLEAYIDNFCCLFTVKLKGLENDFLWESYISTSRCIAISENHISNNGRLSSADWCILTITELDWDIIQKVYTFSDDIEITGLRIYKRGYLPKVFIESILGLYKKKTELKGLADKVVEYMVSKNMANASFGMAVTDIVRDEFTYTEGEWGKLKANRKKQLGKYNKNFQRFLFYPWGVWVTAHARHNLWEAIFEFGEDYVYADTDSIKGIKFDQYLQFFEDYNKRVVDKLTSVSKYYNIPLEDFMPKTKKGVQKIIGVFEREENYELFKTLGAKRYIYVYENGELGLTTSGVNKKYALPYLMAKYIPGCEGYYDLFKQAYNPLPGEYDKSTCAFEKIKELNLDYTPVIDAFAENLRIPEGYSGKQSLTYIDDPRALYFEDYLGNFNTAVEKSSIHMEPASYFFSISVQYNRFLNGIREEYY